MHLNKSGNIQNRHSFLQRQVVLNISFVLKIRKMWMKLRRISAPCSNALHFLTFCCVSGARSTGKDAISELKTPKSSNFNSVTSVLRKQWKMTSKAEVAFVSWKITSQNLNSKKKLLQTKKTRLHNIPFCYMV